MAAYHYHWFVCQSLGHPPKSDLQRHGYLEQANRKEEARNRKARTETQTRVRVDTGAERITENCIQCPVEESRQAPPPRKKDNQRREQARAATQVLTIGPPQVCVMWMQLYGLEWPILYVLKSDQRQGYFLHTKEVHLSTHGRTKVVRRHQGSTTRPESG